SIYIAIRSTKHDKSISANPRDDFNCLVKLQEFNTAGLDSSNKVKSIVIITVDGEPDENPRFPKTLASSIDIFKTEVWVLGKHQICRIQIMSIDSKLISNRFQVEKSS
ncbi:unnamed protein product, partial [Rotaria sordida]